MKAIFLLIAMTATAANAQSTNCYVSGAYINCQTDHSANVLAGITNRLLSPSAVNGFQEGQRAYEQRQAASVPVSVPVSLPGAAERRAAAYSRVGDLIAQEHCVEANRLAAFYNHPDIIADTARACPL